jgi:Fe2+ or Zn2+ uptake regulation protein
MESLHDMLPERVFSALGSKTRIEILRILAAKPSGVKEILNELNKRGFEIRYRESVYRALEKLVAVGLIEKFYDKKEKAIRYHLVKAKLEVDLRTGKVTDLQNKLIQQKNCKRS